MVLTVPIEQFSEAVQRYTKSTDVYVTVLESQTVVTAFAPDTATIVCAKTSVDIQEVRATLTKAGLKVFDGHWSDGETLERSELWIGAVAYKSVEETPGLWVNAFRSKPSTGQVLSALYEEFRVAGDVGEVSLEEFIRLADPNVVILSPSEQALFASRSDEDA